MRTYSVAMRIPTGEPCNRHRGFAGSELRLATRSITQGKNLSEEVRVFFFCEECFQNVKARAKVCYPYLRYTRAHHIYIGG